MKMGKMKTVMTRVGHFLSHSYCRNGKAQNGKRLGSALFVVGRWRVEQVDLTTSTTTTMTTTTTTTTTTTMRNERRDNWKQYSKSFVENRRRRMLESSPSLTVTRSVEWNFWQTLYDITSNPPAGFLDQFLHLPLVITTKPTLVPRHQLMISKRLNTFTEASSRMLERHFMMFRHPKHHCLWYKSTPAS